jgi:hypothetical protein
MGELVLRHDIVLLVAAEGHCGWWVAGGVQWCWKVLAAMPEHDFHGQSQAVGGRGFLGLCCPELQYQAGGWASRGPVFASERWFGWKKGFVSAQLSFGHCLGLGRYAEIGVSYI